MKKKSKPTFTDPLLHTNKQLNEISSRKKIEEKKNTICPHRFLISDYFAFFTDYFRRNELVPVAAAATATQASAPASWPVRVEASPGSCYTSGRVFGLVATGGKGGPGTATDRVEAAPEEGPLHT